jgi:hypothetical protein
VGSHPNLRRPDEDRVAGGTDGVDPVEVASFDRSSREAALPM